MVVYAKERERSVMPTLLLGMLGGWTLSALMRASGTPRHHGAVGTRQSFSGTLEAALSTMRADVAAAFSMAASPVEVLHQQYLTAYGALTSSLRIVIEHEQVDAGTDYSKIKLGLIDQRIGLSESVFNKVLAMPDVKAAVAEISRRTGMLKTEADVMPHTTAVLAQGNKVVKAAASVASFANGLG